MELYLKIPIIVVAAYFIGNVRFAVILARLKKKEISELGSGNPGTMNMLRNFGMGLASVTLALDALKGALPAFLAYLWLKGDLAACSGTLGMLGYYFEGASKLGFYIGGMPVIVGHVFPAAARFKGGKGVATSFGVFTAANPVIAPAVFLLSVIILQLVRRGAISSFLFVGALAAVESVFAVRNGDNITILVLVCVIFVLVVFAHRSNIKRMIDGNENETYVIKIKNERRRH